MAQPPKRRQASLERKAAKRKEKQHAAQQLAPASDRAVLCSAGKWPLEECLVSRNWREEAALVQILVARRSAAGRIAAGVFLVDLGCLGVKNAFARLFDSRGEYGQLRQHLIDTQPMTKADLNLAARILRAGLDYARGLGFGPDPDYYEAAVLLEGADPDASSASILLGKDGKPFYVSGPYDNVRRIMAKLEKAVGPGNFLFIVPAGPADEVIIDERDVA